MKGTKQIYEEIMTVEIERERFEHLCMTQGLKSGIDYKIKKVEVPEFPYKDNEKWKAQKKISNAEYKKLKEIEFELRHP